MNNWSNHEIFSLKFPCRPHHQPTRI